jgi:indole-3-glycerol phosphate synthase
VSDFLRAMTIASERRSRLAGARMPLPEIRMRARDVPDVVQLRLSPGGFDVIAEVKRRSPSTNGTRPASTDEGMPARLARAYARFGAAAVSVLTEPFAFGGSLADLGAARDALRASDRPVPVMRKDFIVDAYQVHESRAAGADGVLLIADMLPSPASDLMDAVEETGLWLLVEAFADEQLDRALELVREARSRGVTALVGVNARDLRSLAVDPDRTARLAARLPEDIPAVAESGLGSAADAAAAATLGYRLALVGSALMAHPDPGTLLADMIERGRRAAGER